MPPAGGQTSLLSKRIDKKLQLDCESMQGWPRNATPTKYPAKFASVTVSKLLFSFDLELIADYCSLNESEVQSSVQEKQQPGLVFRLLIATLATLEF
jgi:hypothetical protein